MRTWRISNAL